jgi:hypothetical protein
LLAIVPSGEYSAIRGGLEYYYRYVTVLRMARNCFNPELGNCLSVRLIDCNDDDKFKAMSPKEKADPSLPEAPRDQSGVYALKTGFKFCVKVANSSPYPLNVFLLNCSSGGIVESLGDAIIRERATQTMWLDNKLGAPFEVNPDELPGPCQHLMKPNFVTDRMVAVGTTRRDIDLDYLYQDKTVQQVIQEIINRSFQGKSLRSKPESIAPAELWASVITNVRLILP